MTSEARVPHDPADLRDAAKLVRKNIGWWPQKSIDEYNAWADRLEAWADDMEREPHRSLTDWVAGRVDAVPARLAPLEAAVLDAAKGWADMHDGTWPSTDDIFATHDALRDAVRALQEATDA